MTPRPNGDPTPVRVRIPLEDLMATEARRFSLAEWIKKHWPIVTAIVVLIGLGVSSTRFIMSWAASKEELAEHKVVGHPEITQYFYDLRERVALQGQTLERLDALREHIQWQTNQIVRISERLKTRVEEPPVKLTNE